MLHELAISYAARYSTTSARLIQYLNRKIRERGWAGEGPPELEGLVARMTDLGIVDDQAFAHARARSMARRGLGAGRIGGALRAAGVEAETRRAALGDVDAAAAAEAFARRRRLGCYRDAGPVDRMQAEKDLAAMLRAGHGWAAAKAALWGAADEVGPMYDEG